MKHQQVGKNQTGQLAYVQHALYFFQDINPEAVAYNISIGVRVDEIFPEQPLEDALALLLESQLNLTSYYELVDGVPVQMGNRSINMPLTRVDATQITAAQLNRDPIH